MQRYIGLKPWARPPRSAFLAVTALGLLVNVAGYADLPDGPATPDQVARGRSRIFNGACADRHGHYKADPSDAQWLSGFVKGRDEVAVGAPFQIGPFKTYPRNLTPDPLTGLGRIAPRQIFNALRYGLKPADTPDVVITSNVPGQGNFPVVPKYLAIPMPWPTFRHMPDSDTWDIVAYLKHGIKAVNNKVPDSEGPPDFWASDYTADKIGPFPAVAYPAASEEFQQ